MRYMPLLPDGREVPQPWQIKQFYYNVTWPLKDNPTKLMKFFDYLAVSFILCITLCMVEAEIQYIIENLSDFSLTAEVLVMCVVLHECMLRVFNMTVNKNASKSVLKEFYQSIYMEEKTNPVAWKRIHQGLIPATVYSYTYAIAFLFFQIVPLLYLGQEEKVLPYKMSLHQNLNNPIWYGVTLLGLFLVGLNMTFLMIGESFLLATFILHLNARYFTLQEELQQDGRLIFSNIPNDHLAFEYRRKIIKLHKKNCFLDSFAENLDKIYNFRTFVNIAFSAVLICVMLMQMASVGTSTTKNIGFGCWTVAKVTELIIFGTLGSTLIHTTDKMNTAYYLSNWEDIIYRSTNTKQNVCLMKDINILVCIHQKPKHITGYNFFDVSLDTVVNVLRGAFSYYTCLHSMDQSKKN